MTIQVFPSLTNLAAYPFARKPVFSTVTQDSFGGRTSRYAQLNSPIWRWTVDYNILRSLRSFSDMQTLTAFYCQMLGPATAFSYQAVEDYTVTAQAF